MVDATVDAVVAGLEVGDDVLGAGLLLVQSGVGQLDDARRSSGAACVEKRSHVGRAADVDVGVDAAAEPHAPELGRLHDDHVARRTAGVERLPLAVVAHHRHIRRQRCTPNTASRISFVFLSTLFSYNNIACLYYQLW